jgi:hypothetical protein
MKTNLSLMLGKIETTRGEDPLPTATDDAFLVGDLDYQIDPTPLERNVFRRSFSPVPTGVGRKAVNISFSHEIKGSGNSSIRPKLGTLLRACGMREILVTSGAATQIEDPVPYGAVTSGPDVSFSKDTAPNGTQFGSYKIRVVTGGASGTAAVQVTRWAGSTEDNTVLPNTRNDARVNDSSTMTLAIDASDETAIDYTVGGTFQAGSDLYAVVNGLVFAMEVTSAMSDNDGVATALAAIIDADARLSASASGPVVTVTFLNAAAPVTVTSGTTEIVLGASGAGITPTWSGNLVEGQEWVVSLYETGYTYKPVSESALVESITLYIYRDGVLIKSTACTGTVTFTGETGNVAVANFEFQGNYSDPVEEPIPLSATLEDTTPPQVELAELTIKGSNDFCSQSFTITLGNETNLKECMNASEGYDGSQITGREPTAQLNPEATYEAYVGFWNDVSVNSQFPIHLRVGSVADNMVRFYMERANFTGLTYGDRNNSVTFESNFSLNGLSAAGDDELRVVFS